MMYSCDYLDIVPDQVPTFDNAFSDRYTTEKYLATCYWSIPRTGYNVEPSLLGAGEMILNKEHQAENGMLILLGLRMANKSVYSFWGSNAEGGARSLHAGIRDCNTFLENINSVKDLNDYEKKRMVAEVKTLKAYMHFYLICFYGPICPLRENISVSESSMGVRVYREKIDDCFAYVVQLLDEVIESDGLPHTIINQSTELGRLVRAAAYTLKAKALSYWASPFFNGNTDYNYFLDHNGEPFFNQTYDETRWQEAAEACIAAVNICAEDGIRLFQPEDYTARVAQPVSPITKRINTLRGSYSERWTSELIWSNTSSTVNESMQYAAMARMTNALAFPSGILSVPFSTVELFYSSNGVPIEEDKEWQTSGQYQNRFEIRTGDEEHKYLIQQGEQTATMNFDREPRFYSTLGFDRGKWYGNHHENSPLDDSQTLYPKNRWGEVSSQMTQGNYNATGYWPKKMVNFSTSFIDENRLYGAVYGNPLMRFSDLLLLTAEALNESKAAPDAEVYKYIDDVRERAGLEGVVDSWSKYSSSSNKPSTKAGMREIIQRERRIELACEGAYYWDSHRWKTAIRDQNRQLQGWTVIGTTADTYYSVNSIYKQRFVSRDYLAPIPESDLIRNPNLIQNPGW
jgi:hypothetical protein